MSGALRLLLLVFFVVPSPVFSFDDENPEETLIPDISQGPEAPFDQINGNSEGSSAEVSYGSENWGESGALTPPTVESPEQVAQEPGENENDPGEERQGAEASFNAGEVGHISPDPDPDTLEVAQVPEYPAQAFSAVLDSSAATMSGERHLSTLILSDLEHYGVAFDITASGGIYFRLGSAWEEAGEEGFKIDLSGIDFGIDWVTCRTEMKGGQFSFVLEWKSRWGSGPLGSVRFLYNPNGVLTQTLYRSGSEFVLLRDFDSQGRWSRESKFIAGSQAVSGQPSQEASSYVGTAYPAYESHARYFYQPDGEENLRLRVEFTEITRGPLVQSFPIAKPLLPEFERDPEHTVTISQVVLSTFLPALADSGTAVNDLMNEFNTVKTVLYLGGSSLESPSKWYGAFKPIEASITTDRYLDSSLHYFHEEAAYNYTLGNEYHSALMQNDLISGWRLTPENEKVDFSSKHMLKMETLDENRVRMVLVTEKFNFVHYGCMNTEGKIASCPIESEKPYEIYMDKINDGYLGDWHGNVSYRGKRLTGASKTAPTRITNGNTTAYPVYTHDSQSYQARLDSSLLANKTGIDDSLVDMIRDMATARVEESETDASDPVEGRKFMVYERNESGHMVLTRIYYLLANGS
ncbi:MAG: hypothetical protein ACOY3K_03455, partial [Candidatus Omnitrophota bacterium]